MKVKQILIAGTMLVSVATFAQKDQIKAAEKALKAGNENTALTILKEAETLSLSAPDAEKAQFNFVKGNAYFSLANKNDDADNNYAYAAKSYQDVLEIEQDSECGIYIEEFDEWKEDDIISAFELIEKKKK